MKTKTKDQLSGIALLLIGVVVISCIVYYETTLWDECRQTNSFLYCIRVLG